MRWLILFISLIVKTCFASDFLPVWQAFQVSAVAESKSAIWVKFDIADEYHIYQNKIKISTEAGSTVQLGMPLLPDPVILKDKDLGQFLVYEHKVAIQVPVVNYGSGMLKLKVNYQGCKGLDLCYPEQSVILDINSGLTAKIDSQKENPVVQGNTSSFNLKKLINNDANADQVASFFKEKPFLVVSGFFIVGLLIAFTPCVFPMLPVLLGVISGVGISTQRSTVLAFAYILGGAVAYALGGVIAASFGYNISSLLQNTWLISVIAIIFVIFASSLFGAFELQLPASWQNRLNTRLNRFSNRSIPGAFIVGAISTLILSPCVTAPLAGALVYISSTGNVWLGGSSLFAMGLGSGLPLLLIAVFGKHLMPKAGLWMLLVKRLLGMLMLVMAIYMLSRIVPEIVSHGLYLCWLVALIYIIFHALNTRVILRYSLASVASVIVLAVTVHLGYFKIGTEASRFTVVNNQATLDQVLQSAQSDQRPVLLDFYADWCVACKEMDIKTFNDTNVIQLMNHFKLVRIDVSDNNQSSRNLLEKYNVLAPPSIVFIGKHGKPLTDYQITGFVSNGKLHSTLKELLRGSDQTDGCLKEKC